MKINIIEISAPVFGIRLPFSVGSQVKFKFPRLPWELTSYSTERDMHLGNWHPGWQVKT